MVQEVVALLPQRGAKVIIQSCPLMAHETVLRVLERFDLLVAGLANAQAGILFTPEATSSCRPLSTYPSRMKDQKNQTKNK